MLKKVLEYEFLTEAILVSVIVFCLFALLFKVVIPNFGSKSLAASWMTMFGAVVIFAYSLFVELKEESFKSSFNTYVCFTEKIEFFNYIVPFYRLGDCGLLRYQDSESMIYKNDGLTIHDGIDVGSELVLINAISYVSSDFRDWRSEKYTSPGSWRMSYRNQKDANGDAVILENSALRAANFKYFEFLPQAAHEFGGYSILPKGSRLSLNGKKLTLRNSQFLFEVEPFEIGRTYRMESASPEVVWATEYEVRVSYKLLKSRAGHWRRPECKDFCLALAEGIKAQLEVPSERWPKSLSWM